MATNLERYEILKRHMHEEAARVIAETFPTADQIVTKDYLDARLAELRTEFRTEIHNLSASTHRWLLTFMATQWLGFAGMITAFVLKS